MSQLPGGLDDLPQAVCTLPALTALHLDNQAGVCRWLPGLSQATSLQDLVVRWERALGSARSSKSSRAGHDGCAAVPSLPHFGLLCYQVQHACHFSALPSALL